MVGNMGLGGSIELVVMRLLHFELVVLSLVVLIATLVVVAFEIEMVAVMKQKCQGFFDCRSASWTGLVCQSRGLKVSLGCSFFS